MAEFSMPYNRLCKIGIGLLLVLFCAPGCTNRQTRRLVAEQLAIGPTSAVSTEEATLEAYRVAFPDVLEIVVPNRPDCSGRFPIDTEGRVAIAALRNPRVDGKTVHAVAREIGDRCGLRPGQATCRVAEYRSRFVYVYGPVNGPERAVAYRGPETVVTFLRRIGGVQTGAKLDEIHVIRSNMAPEKKPEVFTVNLEAILVDGDNSSNVVLCPFDSIYVGELKRARLGKALPPWLRPFYRGFCDVFPEACPHDWRKQIRDE